METGIHKMREGEILLTNSAIEQALQSTAQQGNAEMHGKAKQRYKHRASTASKHNNPFSAKDARPASMQELQNRNVRIVPKGRSVKCNKRNVWIVTLVTLQMLQAAMVSTVCLRFRLTQTTRPASLCMHQVIFLTYAGPPPAGLPECEVTAQGRVPCLPIQVLATGSQDPPPNTCMGY